MALLNPLKKMKNWRHFSKRMRRKSTVFLSKFSNTKRTSPRKEEFIEVISEEHSYLSVTEEVVGFDNDAQSMMEKLITASRYLDIISIVGIAGIGKTTLARKVYNDPVIKYHFHVRAWVTISEEYNDRKLLLLDILSQITDDRPESLTCHELGHMLRQQLMDRKFLIVLDGIWEVNAWEDLCGCIPDNGNASRILVTTRVSKVAKEISLDPYFLSLLNDKQSWELLRKKVFQGERCPPELCGVGARVAKISKGLPLVIIMIATAISKIERRATLWLEVAKDVSSHYLGEQIKMVQLIFDHLEDHLKSCLLYMGLFPTRYEIPVSDLLKWWMAEDLTQHIGTSRNFLNVLIDRDLVIVSKRRTNGEMKYCKVHDQVHEFCVRKITEEKFMQVAGSQEQRLFMYIHENIKSDFIAERESFKPCQSPLEFIAHPKFSKLDHMSLFPLLHNLRFVRVLDLLDIYLQDAWANAFQELTHLRYLAIFVKVFNFKWVSHISLLQTLKVRSSFIMISPAIWKMTKLMHVDINEFSITWEENERVKFEESSEIVLDNLKTLGTCSMSVVDMTPKFWGKFHNLEELRLHIDEYGDIHNYSLLGKTDGHVRCLDFPSSLKFLSLSDIFLTDEVVSGIAQLKRLETLKLSEIYFTGEQHWDLLDKEFDALKVLKLHRVFMTKWHIWHKSFPLLERLVIKNCSKLEEIPINFADIMPLQSIRVVDCSDSVGISAKRIKEYNESWGNYSFEVHVLKTNDARKKRDKCGANEGVRVFWRMAGDTLQSVITAVQY